MITEQTIRQLAYLTTREVEIAIRKNYPQDSFVASKFLGITNGGQFCYLATWIDEGRDRCTSKVYVSLGQDNQPVGEY